MEHAKPGILNGSRWLHCDLDGTKWPATIRDVVIIDSSLRDSCWDLECGEDIRILGTREFPIWTEDEGDTVETDLTLVLARVDRMQWTGRATGVTLSQVAGKDVCFGEVEDSFWEQTGPELVFPGSPMQMEAVTIIASYLEHLKLYADSYDLDLSHNGVPDLRLGGHHYRTGIMCNLAPESSSAS
jgi:hypothetical protein